MSEHGKQLHTCGLPQILTYPLHYSYSGPLFIGGGGGGGEKVGTKWKENSVL